LSIFDFLIVDLESEQESINQQSEINNLYVSAVTLSCVRY